MKYTPLMSNYTPIISSSSYQIPSLNSLKVWGVSDSFIMEAEGFTEKPCQKY